MDTQEEPQALVWTLELTASTDLGRIAQALTADGTTAVLSTCTRVEQYGMVTTPAGVDFAPPNVLSGRDALEHVAIVAAGADSLVVGETDVLAQVRSAFSNTTGHLRLFGDAAIAAGREARRTVEIEPRDAGYQLEIALRVAGMNAPASVAIVGTGAMAKHLARRARALGSGTVAVAGRNIEHAKRCAAGAGVDATCVEALPGIAKDACLVLAFKGTPTPVMQEYILRAAQQAALVIDLTMPPFDWGDSKLKSLVDLESMARADCLSDEDRELQERLAGAALAAVDKLWERRFADGAAPRLYRRVEQLRLREVARAAKQPNTNIEQIDVVTKALVKHLFHRYAQALRDGQDNALITVTEELFRFEED